MLLMEWSFTELSSDNCSNLSVSKQDSKTHNKDLNIVIDSLCIYITLSLMTCQSYWNSIVLKSIYRLTLQSIAFDYFELPLHYCHMKMIVITYFLYQN